MSLETTCLNRRNSATSRPASRYSARQPVVVSLPIPRQDRPETALFWPFLDGFQRASCGVWWWCLLDPLAPPRPKPVRHGRVPMATVGVRHAENLEGIHGRQPLPARWTGAVRHREDFRAGERHEHVPVSIQPATSRSSGAGQTVAPGYSLDTRRQSVAGR